MARYGRTQPHKPLYGRPPAFTFPGNYTQLLSEVLTNSDTVLKSSGRIISEIITDTDSLFKLPGKVFSEISTFIDQANALFFDGSQNYVNMGSLGSFGSSMKANGVYLFATIKTTSSTLGSITGVFNHIGNSAFDIYMNAVTGGDLTVLIRDQSAGVFICGVSVPALIDGNKHDIEIIADLGAQTAVIKVDGLSKSVSYSATGLSGSIIDFAQSLLIGARYNSTLADRFLAIKVYKFKIGYTSSNLLASYSLSEGSGTTLTDLTGNSNTGTLTGSPLPQWLLDPYVSFSLSRALAEAITHTDTLLKSSGRIMIEVISHVDSLLKQTGRIMIEVNTYTDTLLKQGGKLFHEYFIVEDANYSVTFDDTQNYIDLGTDPMVGLSEFTVFIIAKPTHLSGHAHVLLANWVAGQNTILFRLNGSDVQGFVNRQVGGQAGGNFGFSISLNTIYKLGFRYTGAEIAGFNNGVKGGTTYSTTGIIRSTSTASLAIGGANRNASEHPFSGPIGKVLIYNRALSDSEMVDLSNGTIIKGGLINYFGMNEGSGTSIADKFGGLIGTFTGSPSPTWSDALVDGFVLIITIGRFLNENTIYIDSMLRSIGRIMSEAITNADAVIKTAGRNLIETITHTDILITLFTYGRNLTETITHSDTFTGITALGRVFTETITNTLSFIPSLNGSDWFIKLRSKYVSFKNSLWYTKNNTKWKHDDD